jgi:hypothetical protein
VFSTLFFFLFFCSNHIMAPSTTSNYGPALSDTSDYGEITGVLYLFSNDYPGDIAHAVFVGLQYTKNGTVTEVTWPEAVALAAPGTPVVNAPGNGVTLSTITLLSYPDNTAEHRIRFVFSDQSTQEYTQFMQFAGFVEGSVPEQTVTRGTGPQQAVRLLRDDQNVSLTWPPAGNASGAIRSTLSGAIQTLNVMSHVVFDDTTGPVNLFGQNTVDATATTAAYFGSHVFTITRGDTVTGIDAAESSTVTFDDVAMANLVVTSCIVKDFTGLSYVSLNPFSGTEALIVNTGSNSAQFAIRRGAYPDAHMIVECLRQNADVAAQGWTFSLNSVNFGANVFDTVKSSAANTAILEEIATDTDVLSWTQNVPLVRQFKLNTIGPSNEYNNTAFVSMIDAGTNRFSLRPGAYRIHWSVPGFGVGNFISYLEHVQMSDNGLNAKVVPDAYPRPSAHVGKYLGRLAFSPNAASSNLDRSEGTIVLQIENDASTLGAGAAFQLVALAEMSAMVNGQGLRTPNQWNDELYSQSVVNNLLSHIEITCLGSVALAPTNSS